MITNTILHPSLKHMKTILLICSCVLSFSALSEEAYVPPIELGQTEASNAQQNLHQDKSNIRNHWQARLAIAKQHAQNSHAKGAPAPRLYPGDFKHVH